jgi:hypothetical protein
VPLVSVDVPSLTTIRMDASYVRVARFIPQLATRARK